MKPTKYKYLVPVLSAGVLGLLFACNKGFLDKSPVGTLNKEILADKNGVNGLLIGAYSLLDGVGGNGGGWGAAASNWVYGSVCADDAYKGSTPSDQGDIAPLETWTANSTNSYPSGKWRLCYDGVQRANEVLRVMRVAKGLSAADTTVISAEAKFLRAHYHFELKKVFNNIPFVDETVTFESGKKVENVSGSGYVNAWPQIEADFTYAMNNLPETQPQIGRANKWAAMAFLAKVYMFEQKYDQAKPLFDQLITSGKNASGVKYNLVGYEANFNPATKNNAETVFSVQMSINDGSGAQGTPNGNYGDVLNFPYNNQPGGCCGFFNASLSLANSYKTDINGLPLLDTYDDGVNVSDYTNAYKGTMDPRVDWVMGRPNMPYFDWGNMPNDDSWIRADQGPNYRFVPKKSSYSKSQKGIFTSTENYWANTQLTANNVNLMRFADVLLMAAECEMQATSGDPNKALAYVNRVRARAADPTGWVYANATYDASKNQYSPQTTPADNYNVGLYPVGAFADKNYALKAIRFERKLELAMEGHRFFDLVRWGVADVTLNAYSAYEKAQKKAYIYYNGPTFTKGKSEYFAIPQSEIDKLNADGQTHLKQNPGY